MIQKFNAKNSALVNVSTHCDSAKGAGHTPYQSIANNYWVGGTRGALHADRT